MAEKEKLTLIVFSGELDKALAAFNLAVGAASSGMEVTMFFTFWGLNVIKKNQGSLKSKGILRQMLNLAVEEEGKIYRVFVRRSK